MSNIKLSVCVTYKNRKNYIDYLLQSLLKNDYPRNMYEIVLVDDRSTDGCKEYIRSKYKNLFNIRYIEMDNKLNTDFQIKVNNPCLGINISVKKAEGDIIVRTDCECILCPTALETAANLKAQKTLWGIARQGSPSKNIDPFNWKDYYSIESPMVPYFSKYDVYNVYDADNIKYFSAGWCNQLVCFWKNDFIKIGGVDEAFASGLAFEDEIQYFMLNKISPVYYDKKFLAYHKDHGQQHYGLPGMPNYQYWLKNKQLCEKIKQENIMIANNERNWGNESQIISIENWSI